MNRAILYLRQSTHREESISLELQEHEGREYAKRRGYEVIGVESDPGISGRTWNRPAVQRVMSMIEARDADVIVLWKWSRLSRSRLDWAVAADRVQVAGGRIESATEPLDTSTSTGRLARGMLTEFAAFESERMGDVWKESHARRIRSGMPANGKPRFGYLYDREKGFAPDALSGPVLAEAFRRYISGESVYSLVQWLNAGPTRPVGGYGVKSDGLWSDRTLRRVMDSGFAAGFINVAGERFPGKHPAIVTPEQWDAYQEARQRRRVYRRAERSPYMFSGLVRCQCGSPMTAGQFGAQRTPKYRCKASHDKRTHAGGYVMASVLEDKILAWLRKRVAQINDDLISLQSGPRPKRVTSALVFDQRIAAVNGKIDNLTEMRVEAGIPQSTYARLRDQYIAERGALEAAKLTAAVGERVTPASIVPDLLANWDRLTPVEVREILRTLGVTFEVWPGRPRSRVEIHVTNR